MKSTAKKVFWLALTVTLFFTALCTGFRIYALHALYTPSLGHFSEGFFSDVFLPLIYILAVVVFLVFGVLFRASLTGRKYKTTLPSLFASGFAGIATLVWLYSFAGDFFSSRYAPPQTLFGILLLLGGLCTAAYLLLNALPHPPHTATVLLGLATALFCLFYAFFAYFDTAFTLNSPVKIFDQITFLVLILFFLAECRFRPGTMHEALYFPVCMTAVLFCASGSLSGLVYSAVEGRPLIGHVMHDFLLFGIFIYTLTRLLSFLIPAFYTSEDLAASIGTPTTFETEGIPVTPQKPANDFAQETFDFDAKADAPAQDEKDGEQTE